jgi:hypothetical protein
MVRPIIIFLFTSYEWGFSPSDKYSFIHYVQDLSEFDGYNFLAAMVAMHQEDIDEGLDLQAIVSATVARSCIMTCDCMRIFPIRTCRKKRNAVL